MAKNEIKKVEQNDNPLALSKELAESLIVGGDLGLLSAEQRIEYYGYICKRNGLDPAMRPVEYLKLNNKTVLYANKGCAEQLRRIHGVSVTGCEFKEIGTTVICTCTVRNSKGRTDTGTGAVLIGNDLALAVMKSETKAKRRATLSICGMGMIDESEIENIPAADKDKDCVSACLIEDAEDDGEAKKKFRDVCVFKTGNKELTAELMKSLLEQAHNLSGLKKIAECATWLKKDENEIQDDKIISRREQNAAQ